MHESDAAFPLPPVPSDLADRSVAGWSESVVVRTYEAGEPALMPAFLENRVYQGSSGRVYPLPFIETINQTPVERRWQALHIENRYLRLVILPELGGRIQIAIDKVSGHDIFYRNNAIKPALVGLAGPWISGGVEFNWPQHHRPGTYLPMDWTIEDEPDGSVTIWCSDHDPFARMKGMHGIRLRPDSAVIEARVRLFNRTETTQTFLWWANVAVRVHDEYQSFFPQDVHAVADHAKRAGTAFPAADRPYYGIDYPARASQRSPTFISADSDRLDWYRNIPVPTSYMCVASEDDFFGGYDHAAGLGFAHVADHHIAPGKKQWTWGNSAFGRAWDANLSEDGAPYIELMAGVYTDNQPDFSYLAPGETKSFSQYWFPYHGIGPLTQATTRVGLRLTVNDGTSATIGVIATELLPEVRLRLTSEDGAVVWESRQSIEPGRPFLADVPLARGNHTLCADEMTSFGSVTLATTSTERRDAAPEGFEAATEPPAPSDIESIDELYLTGIHLAQYRHATRLPEPYWAEALRRDPGDARSNVAMGSLRLNAGLLSEAEAYFRAALSRQTRRNPNPADGEACYLLGVTLTALGRDVEADASFAKAAWSWAWRSASHVARARIAARRGDWSSALEQADAALRVNADHSQAVAIRAIALRQASRPNEANALLRGARALDPLDAWLRDLDGETASADAGILRDLAEEYRSLGLNSDALRVLTAARAAPVVAGAGDPRVLIHYARAELLGDLGDTEAALAALTDARRASVDRCFAATLSDALLLGRRIALSDDARAHALLGHWLYFHRRYDAATTELELADALSASDDPVVLRGLGLAAYNVRHDSAEALHYYQRAIGAAPFDAKLRVEADQLARRVGVLPAARLEVLESIPSVIEQRDDLVLAFAELLVLVGREHEAEALLLRRRFSPWEGGEGEAIRVWTLVQRAVAAVAAENGDATRAVAALMSAVDVPATLGEAPHPLANRSDLYLALGDAEHAAGRAREARAAWSRAATSAGDFTSMQTVAHSPMTYYSVVAARRLGEFVAANRLRDDLDEFVRAAAREQPSIDYFATSLPTMLTFHDDVALLHAQNVTLMEAQVAMIDGDHSSAIVLLDPIARRDPADALVRRLIIECQAALDAAALAGARTR